MKSRFTTLLTTAVLLLASAAAFGQAQSSPNTTAKSVNHGSSDFHRSVFS
jgi:hypothetical protein